MKRRHVVAAVLTCALSGLVFAAAPAQAQLSVSSFSLTPSSTQANSSPDVTVKVRFSSSDGDTPQSTHISLAPGLLANPTAPTACADSSFEADDCPDSSKIGEGTVSGFAWGWPVTLPAEIYSLGAGPGQLARIGIIVDFFGSPVALLEAPVLVRSSPDAGLDIPIDNIPDQIAGGPVEIAALSLTLNGSANGQPFTRLPTSCTAANTHIVVTSYGDPSNPSSAESSFTPSGCDNLSYAPQLSASDTPDKNDTGVAFSTTITQSASEAATRQIAVTLPPSLAPRVSALANVCTSSDLSQCPNVGSATVSSPLLAAPVQGKLVLTQQGLDVAFGPPLGLVLQGSPTIVAGNLSATFTGIPDVPITSLQVSFAGGANSLLTLNSSACSQPQNVAADLTAYNGDTAHVSAALSSSGCQSGASGTARKPTASMHFCGRKHPRLHLKLVAGQNALKSVSLTLPGGLRLASNKLPHGISITLDGKRGGRVASANGRSLTIALGNGTRSASILLRPPSLIVGPRIRAVRAHHPHHLKLKLLVTLTDTSGKQTQLTLTQLL